MKLTVRKMAVAGVLGAASIVLGLTPIGFIPVPGPAGHATIMHVPAILAGIAEGPVVGLVVGAIFGILSFLRATVPAFADPLVAILPRLFIGVFAAYAYMGFRRYGMVPGLIVAGAVGTLTNTVLVLSMMVIRNYMPVEAAFLTAVTHGIPELIVAAVVCAAVGGALARAGLLRPVNEPAKSPL